MSRRSKKKEEEVIIPDMAALTFEPPKKDVQRSIDIAITRLDMVIDLLESNEEQQFSKKTIDMVLKNLKQIKSDLAH